MPDVIVYHHDPIEVDPRTSWTGLCRGLRGAQYLDIRAATDAAITDLFDYARPDAVVVVDGKPVASIEQTQMNPSGHNIPQRFTSLVRAAELGVTGILYYPKFSRRTFSDPNVRYLQVRVPLANLNLMETYSVPSLSLFWPTDQGTLLPNTDPRCHGLIAAVVDALIVHAGKPPSILAELAEVKAATSEMREAIEEYGNSSRYRQNESVRALRPDGFDGARLATSTSIDPPGVVRLSSTRVFVRELARGLRKEPGWKSTREILCRREQTLVLSGTPNSRKTDSEHPWPGYLTLIDILYARTAGGRLRTERETNLAYRLPIDLDVYLERARRASPPTAIFIVDTFADVIVLNNGVVAGRPIRGVNSPDAILR